MMRACGYRSVLESGAPSLGAVAFEKGVLLAPSVGLFAQGARYSIEPNRVGIPGVRVGHKSGLNAIASDWAPGHHSHLAAICLLHGYLTPRPSKPRIVASTQSQTRAMSLDSTWSVPLSERG